MRSDYGGFTSFAFNSGYSMVALSGQDDHTYLVNFENEVKIIKLAGHSSFISRSLFYKMNDKVYRVIVSSLDGYLSFTEISKD